jgi:hypothetical protein
MKKATIVFHLLVLVNISEKPFNLLPVPEVYENGVLKVRWMRLIC